MAHQKIPILCIDIDPQLKGEQNYEDETEDIIVFVSGGLSGVIIVWKLAPNTQDNEYSLVKERAFNITPDPSLALKEPKFQVQSLQFRDMMIIAGTRSGDIYLFRYEPDMGEGQRAQSSDDMLQVYSAHDNEIPKEVDFNANHTTLFCITEKGLFSAWNFETLRTEATIPFAKTTINMIVMKKHDRKVLIAFDTQIILLNTDSFAKYEEFTCDFQKKVTDVKLSKKEDKMAVAFAAGNDGNACIEVYKIDHSINKAVRHAIIENKCVLVC